MAKIRDEGEARRWIEEGRTYRWMAEEHLRKYDVQVSPEAFSALRRRLGIDRRNNRDDELIPWSVRPEHRSEFDLIMLRAEARVRAGRELTPVMARKHASWIARLRDEGLVVYYDPDTEEGFFLVPREPQDTDLVRKPPPEQQTHRRPID